MLPPQPAGRGSVSGKGLHEAPGGACPGQGHEALTVGPTGRLQEGPTSGRPLRNALRSWEGVREAWGCGSGGLSSRARPA